MARNKASSATGLNLQPSLHASTRAIIVLQCVSNVLRSSDLALPDKRADIGLQ